MSVESKSELKKKFVTSCRKYNFYVAKQQETEDWFRRHKNLKHTKVYDDKIQILDLIKKILSVLSKIKANTRTEIHPYRTN